MELQMAGCSGEELPLGIMAITIKYICIAELVHQMQDVEMVKGRSIIYRPENASICACRRCLSSQHMIA